MQRKREHRIAANRILRDERLSPNRGLLALMVTMYFDAETDEERGLLDTLLRGAFGNNPKSIRWRDEEDNAPDAATRLDMEQTAALRSVFDAVLQDKPKATTEETT